MDNNLIKPSVITFIGTIAFFICLGFLFGKRDIYSDELIGTISLIFPVIAYLYNWTKHRDIFWKSFMIGTVSAIVFLLIGFMIYATIMFR